MISRRKKQDFTAVLVQQMANKSSDISMLYTLFDCHDLLVWTVWLFGLLVVCYFCFVFFICLVCLFFLILLLRMEQGVELDVAVCVYLSEQVSLYPATMHILPLAEGTRSKTGRNSCIDKDILTSEEMKISDTMTVTCHLSSADWCQTTLWAATTLEGCTQFLLLSVMLCGIE